MNKKNKREEDKLGEVLRLCHSTRFYRSATNPRVSYKTRQKETEINENKKNQ